jgi:hypothetical protein
MRTRCIAVALGASLFISTTAIAAAPPFNVLFAGTVERSYAQAPNAGTGFTTLCIIDGAQSAYLRKNTGFADRLISLPDINLAPNGSVGPDAYTVGGQAQLRFDVDNNKAGRIHFAPVPGYPIAVNKPRFIQYSENYEIATATLTVSFTIRFENCDLPVSATYRN